MRLADILAGGPGSGCHGPNCGRPPKNSIPLADFALTPAQKVMETRFRAQIARDPAGMKARYRAEFGNVISADSAKELSADYRKNRYDGAAAVHTPASWLSKELFAEDLQKPAPPGKENMVLFTAGGPGAGKTSAISQVGSLSALAGKAQIVFDGTMRPASKAIKLVEQTLRAGKTAQVVFTYRDPEEALTDGVLGRSKRQAAELGTGRTVPLREFAAQHASVLDSMKGLEAHFKNDPRVTIVAVNNSLGRGKAQKIELADVPRSLPADELHDKLRGVLDREYAKGNISSRLYRATMGASAAQEVGM
jgi:hypothetical protein